jgi:hypothetical protein
MGEGIGAAALEQHHGGQGITDPYLPAGVSQSQGRKGAGGACPVHLGPQNRFGLDHGVWQISPGHGHKKAAANVLRQLV